MRGQKEIKGRNVEESGGRWGKGEREERRETGKMEKRDKLREDGENGWKFEEDDWDFHINTRMKGDIGEGGNRELVKNISGSGGNRGTTR